MVLYCTKCKTEASPPAKFCATCGTPLTDLDQGQASAAGYSHQDVLGAFAEHNLGSSPAVKPTPEQPNLKTAPGQGAAKRDSLRDGMMVLGTIGVLVALGMVWGIFVRASNGGEIGAWPILIALIAAVFALAGVHFGRKGAPSFDATNNLADFVFAPIQSIGAAKKAIKFGLAGCAALTIICLIWGSVAPSPQLADRLYVHAALYAACGVGLYFRSRIAAGIAVALLFIDLIPPLERPTVAITAADAWGIAGIFLVYLVTIVLLIIGLRGALAFHRLSQQTSGVRQS